MFPSFNDVTLQLPGQPKVIFSLGQTDSVWKHHYFCSAMFGNILSIEKLFLEIDVNN
jgi:hypothetical protein